MFMEQKEILANHLTAPEVLLRRLKRCKHLFNLTKTCPIEEAESGEKVEVDSFNSGAEVADAVKHPPWGVDVVGMSWLGVWGGWHLEQDLGLHC